MRSDRFDGDEWSEVEQTIIERARTLNLEEMGESEVFAASGRKAGRRIEPFLQVAAPSAPEVLVEPIEAREPAMADESTSFAQDAASAHPARTRRMLTAAQPLTRQTPSEPNRSTHPTPRALVLSDVRDMGGGDDATVERRSSRVSATTRISRLLRANAVAPSASTALQQSPPPEPRPVPPSESTGADATVVHVDRVEVTVEQLADVQDVESFSRALGDAIELERLRLGF